MQTLTDRYDQRAEIVQRLRDDVRSAVDSSFETQNESDIDRRRRAITETQTYLGAAPTALVSGNETTSPTKARSTCSETETEGVEEVKDSESSANETEKVHKTMLSAVNDIVDEGGPYLPASPFGDEESAEENQTTVPETPQTQPGPSAPTSNSKMEQT